MKKFVFLIVIFGSLSFAAKVIYNYFPITKSRIVGIYTIDDSFYPGKNAEWQKALYSFEITSDDKFIFREKLADSSFRTTLGTVHYYRNSSPILFRIVLSDPHPLVDEYPSLYRGNRKFYYVFESKFGNMFYRKSDGNDS